VTRLRDAMEKGRFTAYQPLSLRVVDGRVTDADADGIRADLTELRRRFDSLITYDAIHGAQQIPAIAAALKFRALIIGVRQTMRSSMRRSRPHGAFRGWSSVSRSATRCCSRIAPTRPH
jgi:hypothetical protein